VRNLFVCEGSEKRRFSSVFELETFLLFSSEMPSCGSQNMSYNSSHLRKSEFAENPRSLSYNPSLSLDVAGKMVTAAMKEISFDRESGKFVESRKWWSNKPLNIIFVDPPALGAFTKRRLVVEMLRFEVLSARVNLFRALLYLKVIGSSVARQNPRAVPRRTHTRTSVATPSRTLTAPARGSRLSRREPTPQPPHGCPSRSRRRALHSSKCWRMARRSA
jgi:hypothetical protein